MFNFSFAEKYGRSAAYFINEAVLRKLPSADSCRLDGVIYPSVFTRYLSVDTPRYISCELSGFLHFSFPLRGLKRRLRFPENTFQSSLTVLDKRSFLGVLRFFFTFFPSGISCIKWCEVGTARLVGCPAAGIKLESKGRREGILPDARIVSLCSRRKRFCRLNDMRNSVNEDGRNSIVPSYSHLRAF